MNAKGLKQAENFEIKSQFPNTSM